MINVAGLLVLLGFYAIILVVGLIAARRVNVGGSTWSEKAYVAGRDLNVLIGVFTMTATTVGGGYINGTAESIATAGLVWTLAPFGIFIGLSIGGLVYARKMRDRRYLTMLDPFQQNYGSVIVFLIYLASLVGDIFWTASILSALGTSLSVIIDLNVNIAIVVSASVTVAYTMVGQMIAVAYTDIAQLILITLGLVVSCPFVLTNKNVENIFDHKDRWLGKLDSKFGAVWFDLAVAMTFGTIPWQAYFQRVLSMKSGQQAQILSVAGGALAFILVIPAVLIGAAGTTANWTASSMGESPLDNGMGSMILPLMLHEFTPSAVSILGLGAVSAAVMSSMDSSILGSSSMFSHNIYRQIFRKKASSTELMWIQRFCILILGSIATIVAIFSTTTIYGMFILAADIVFVIILPPLTCAVLLKPFWTNAYGVLAGYVVGIILRFGAGEPALKMDHFIQYPFFDTKDGQLFPFRIFAMLCSLTTICLVSFVTRSIFQREVIPQIFDILNVYKREKELTFLYAESTMLTSSDDHHQNSVVLKSMEKGTSSYDETMGD